VEEAAASSLPQQLVWVVEGEPFFLFQQRRVLAAVVELALLFLSRRVLAAAVELALSFLSRRALAVEAARALPL
jgi:hypothetical protein